MGACTRDTAPCLGVVALLFVAAGIYVMLRLPSKADQVIGGCLVGVGWVLMIAGIWSWNRLPSPRYHHVGAAPADTVNSTDGQGDLEDPYAPQELPEE